MSSKTAIVDLRGVSKTFTTEDLETRAVSDVNLTIRENEFLAVVGPSGCGKSTLLSILAMFNVPTQGTYHFRGDLVNKLDLHERTKLRNEQIGFVFQSFNLLGHLTVFQNVELPMTWRQQFSRSERSARVKAVLEEVGLSHRANHFPSQLSGGQQQRVAVARAVAGSPAILLADEPTGNLDSKNAGAIMDLLRSLHQKGATLVMVTHQPEFAAGATRWVHLCDGRVVSSDVRGAVQPVAEAAT